MRSISLLRIAFDAELLRIRLMMARQGRRAAFAVVALIFALAVLVLAEVVGWLTLRLHFEPIPGTLILLGINLVVGGIFGVLAAWSSPGHTEQEALRVRRHALEAARGSLALTMAVPAVTGLLGGGRDRSGRTRWRLPFTR